MRQALFAPIIFAVCACATPPSLQSASSLRTGCATAARSLDSKPGAEWLRHNGWRFRSEAEAVAAYNRLVEQASPWPEWFQPHQTILPVGTRFQMAIGGGQTARQPGSFGTFDNIRRVKDVRSGLAVKREWKPGVDQVVTYEVAQPLPVNLGPVGPQVDARACRLLIGRWSQLQMLVPPGRRMDYIKIIAVRRIR